MASASTQTVEKYCNLLYRSKLMTQDEVKDAYRRWQEASKGAADDDAEHFRKYLVARRLLTEYQSHLLMRGHAEGYFLDQYKILDLIGKGRMAGVYKSQHSSGQIVAIKVLPPSKAKDANLLSRFQREGKMLTRLDHPNVVRAFQIGEVSGRHYIVMEYLESETLDEVLARRKRLPTAEAVRLIHQALLGLQHVFEKGMVHRDLKPANLALIPPPMPGPNETTLNCTVKILDIGLGRATFDETTQEPDPDTQLTQDGTILGTPEYLAPEQARSAHEVDIRADIYSLGCVFYHLLTGQPPYPPAPGEGVLQQVVRHVTETARPLSSFLTQVPDGLQKVLDWMMAKDPNQRYPTPSSAAQALQSYLTQGGEAPPLPRPAPSYEDFLKRGGHLDGSKPAPALPPRPSPAPAPAPASVPPSIPTGRLESDGRRKERTSERRPEPGAKAPPPPIVEQGEYDVEVVATAPPPEPKKKRAEGEPRSLLELDKRDWIMAGFGAGIVVIAILIGFGVSRLLRGTPPPSTTAQEQKDPEEKPPIRTPKKDPPAEKKDPPVEKVDDKKSEDKKMEDKKNDEKKNTEEKKAEDKKNDEKKNTEEKKAEDKKNDEKKTTEERKAEVNKE